MKREEETKLKYTKIRRSNDAPDKMLATMTITVWHHGTPDKSIHVAGRGGPWSIHANRRVVVAVAPRVGNGRERADDCIFQQFKTCH